MAAAAGDGGGLGVMVQAGAWHGRSPLGTMVTPAEQVVSKELDYYGTLNIRERPGD
jgi:hypothetical protein